MVSFITSFVAVVGLFSVSQPIMAMPLFTVATSLASAVGGGHKMKIRGTTDIWDRGVTPPVAPAPAAPNNKDKPTTAEPPLNPKALFGPCKETMKAHKPEVVHVPNSKNVEISGLGEVCELAVKKYIKTQEHSDKKSVEGTAKIIAPGKVLLSNMPPEFVDELDGDETPQGPKLKRWVSEVFDEFLV